MDDVLDLIDTLLAADTYTSVGRPVVRGLELVKNAGAGAFAKGTGPVGWGFRGADYVVNDQKIIDLPPGLSNQLRLEAEQAKSGAFTGDIVPANDAGDTARPANGATDTGAAAPRADRVSTRVFDP